MVKDKKPSHATVPLQNHANLFLVIINQGMIYSYRKYMNAKNFTHEKQGQCESNAIFKK